MHLPPPEMAYQELKPLPLWNWEAQAKGIYSDILDHPWLQSQPHILSLTQTIVEDIDAVAHLDADQLTQTLTTLQQQIPFELPQTYYSLLNLPAYTDFDLYARYHLGTTTLGLPIYLDIRLYDQEPPIDTYLLNPQITKTDDYTTLTGDHNTTLYNPSHGLSTTNRTITYACRPVGSKYFILFCDRPN